jgi:putative ABC transport system permease protein
LDIDNVAGQLDDDPDVARWTAFAIQPGWSLEGEPTTAIVGYDATADVGLPVLAGRLPKAPGEIAVGRTTARELDVEVGDIVELRGIEGPPQEVTITGETVFPTLGPYQAERVSTGSGLLLPEATLSADERSFAASFVGAELAPGAGTDAERRVHEVVAARKNVTYVNSFTSAVRPSEIVDARSMLAIPIAVCVVFAFAVAAGLLLASWAATRARHQELAILRALGFSGAHVRTSVRVQSVATMLAAAVVAVPAGIVVGRALWRAFADRLGVVPDPAGAWLPIAGVVAGGLVVAVLVAELPARLAARTRPAEGLRTE